MLYPVDLAIYRLIALANRREPREVVNVIFVASHLLPFPAIA